jgi:hypothetical protein
MMAKVSDGNLADFRPLSDNPNQHTQRGLKALEDSIQQDGWVAPITVAADGESLDGAARLEVAYDKMGDEVIVIEHDGTKPVVMVRTDVPDAQSEKGKRIIYRANRVAELDLEWNPDQLLADINAGLDLSDLFADFEIADIVGEALMDVGAGEDVPPQIDRGAELAERYGVETGQIWILGDHSLFCGDAAEANLEGKIAVYDPPYEWPTGQQEHSLNWSRWETAILLGLRNAMPLVPRDDFWHWWIWDSGMARFAGRGYKPMSGCAIVLTFGDSRNWHEAEGLRALDRANIDHFGWPTQVVHIQDHLSGRIAYSKPYPLADYILSLYSAKGDTVVDPFAGAGTFLIAAQNLGRQYLGSEILPEMCAVIIERFYEAFGIEPNLS